MEIIHDESFYQERDRRIDLLNRLMEEENLDALLFTSTAQQTFQMGVKWATFYPLITRRDFCFVAKNEMPYLIVPTSGQAYNASKQSWLPEDHVVGGPMETTIVALIKKLGKEPRLGIYTPDELPALYYKALVETGSELIDITEKMTFLRAPKSPWELNLVNAASNLAIDTLEWVIENVKPGITERVLIGGAEGYLRAHGAEDSLVLCRSIKPHTFITRATNEEIQPEGMFVYSAEVCGPGGYWSQAVRPIFLKQGAFPNAEIALKTTKAALKEALKVARPGYLICDIDTTIDNVVRNMGCKKGAWSGHGMGADLGDGIDIVASNKMPICKGMVLTLHPSVICDDDGVLYGNTYLITEGDPICLTPGYESCMIKEMIQELRNKPKLT